LGSVDIRSIKSYRVFRGAEAPANTDHYLTVAKFAIQPQFKRRLNRTRRFDTDKLRYDLTTASTYAIALNNRFQALADLPDDVESAWPIVRDSFRLAAEETLGYLKPHKRPWLTTDTLEVLEKKSLARQANDTTERKRLQGIFRAKAKADREAYFNRLADEAEAGMRHNDLKPAYKAIRCLRGDTSAQKNIPVTRKDGQACSSQQEVLQRWCEHYSEALNHPTAPPCQELDDAWLATTEDTTIPTDAPTLSEVESAIKKLKLGPAPGGDCIAPEIVKLAPISAAFALHELFGKVWISGRVPSEWKEGIITSLYNGKGPKNDCSSYRPISLLSVPDILHSCSTISDKSTTEKSSQATTVWLHRRKVNDRCYSRPPAAI